MKLRDVLKRRARFRPGDTPAIGRTHGIHAEPDHPRLEAMNWFSEVRRDIERFNMAVRAKCA